MKHSESETAPARCSEFHEKEFGTCIHKGERDFIRSVALLGDLSTQRYLEKNREFCSRTRRTRKITADILVIFPG